MFRSQLVTPQIIKDNNLRVDPPAPESFFWRAWKKNERTAEDTLNTPFMLGIKNDDLFPIAYGTMTVKDAHYCYNGAGSFEVARINAESHHADEKELVKLLTDLTASYVNYNDSFRDPWHILFPDTVVPTEVSQGYVNHERRVANHEHPIYTLVAMLPCYHLWSWMGNSLIDHIGNKMYGFWIEWNQSYRSAHTIGNFIDDWQKDGKVFNEDLAFGIYAKSMEFEYKMFEEEYRPEQLKKRLEEFYHGK